MYVQLGGSATLLTIETVRYARARTHAHTHSHTHTHTHTHTHIAHDIEDWGIMPNGRHRFVWKVQVWCAYQKSPMISKEPYNAKKEPYKEPCEKEPCERVL